MGIELYVKCKEDPINVVKFYDHLAQSIEKGMLSWEEAELVTSARIEALAVRLQVNKREAFKSFREYVFFKCRNLVGNCENKSRKFATFDKSFKDNSSIFQWV